jgi:hypothetical protein
MIATFALAVMPVELLRPEPGASGRVIGFEIKQDRRIRRDRVNAAAVCRTAKS